MKPSHTRLTCRAHNRFSPSLVLWQHFIGTNRPFLHHHRLASTASEGTQDGSLQISSAADAPSQLGADDTQQHSPQGQMMPLRIRKTKGRKVASTWHDTKVKASIHKNLQADHAASMETQTEPDRLLALARAAFDDAQDYAGVVVQPIQTIAGYTEKNLPWNLQANERTMPGIDRLAIEIERFYGYAKPTYAEALARRHVIEQVRDHVQQVLPDHVIEVFGSERTGLAGASSDIDLRLVPKHTLEEPQAAKILPTPGQRFQALKNLHKLEYRGFSRNSQYALVHLRHARYPLISLQDRQSGLDVQVVLSNDTFLSRELMKGYMEQYPYLRELYFVVKAMFDVRGLSDVFKGGFGSYTIFMMVVASIRHSPHPRRDAAGGLINFLKFYRSFDTKKLGISIEPVALLDKKEEAVLTDKVRAKIQEGTNKALPDYMLCLRDPADSTNDLGRRAVAIKHVQTTFKKICIELDRQLAFNTRASLLGPLVGPLYMMNKGRRDRLNAYGSKLSSRLKVDLAEKARMVREREVETEEQEAARLAKEAEDKEWQRKSEERSRMLQEEAERTATLEHGDAMASILGMPSVDHEEMTENEQQDGQVSEAEAEQTSLHESTSINGEEDSHKASG